MTDTKTITIIEQQEGDVPTSGGRVYVSVGGQRLLSGERIVSDSAGVRGLIDELRARGIFEDSITISAVQAEVRKGMLEDDKAADYTVCIDYDDPSLAPALLAVVTERKSCDLLRMEWSYNDDDTIKGWIGACVQRAQGKANAVASALGVKVKAVQDVTVETVDSLLESPTSGNEGQGKGKNEGQTLVPSRRMGVVVETRFQIG